MTEKKIMHKITRRASSIVNLNSIELSVAKLNLVIKENIKNYAESLNATLKSRKAVSKFVLQFNRNSRL